jgi:serine protease Do
MQENAILDAIERYLRGEMLPEEKVFFEHLRKTQPDIDQQVVEHTLFLNHLAQYGEISHFKSQLKQIHREMSDTGAIEKAPSAKVTVLWRKYKRVIGVAASIAGITALGISGLISYFSPKVSNEMRMLSRSVQNTESKVNSLANRLDQGSAQGAIPAPPPNFKSGGTGFLIDGKGYLVTNAHVVKNATRVDVQNAQGEYTARIIYLDRDADLAFLKIEDTAYKAYGTLPYGISRTGTKLGDDLFTLGYPGDKIVYGKGYMSARTGYKGDTLDYQITVAANPGNSGTPVLSKDGDVVGIVRSSQQDAQGMVFAIRSRNIFRAIDSMRVDSNVLKIDSNFNRLHISQLSTIKGLERDQQIERIENCIFIVKSN